MFKCPKCGSEKVYFDGAFIRCDSCGIVVWLKKNDTLKKLGWAKE